jgi:hypothetical protein
MYSPKFPQFAQLSEDEIKAMSEGYQDPSQDKTGELFSSFVAQIAAEKEQSKETVSGKVSKFMKQMCPVAIIALGVVSFAADVSSATYYYYQI